jgi:hypothetical protein
MTYAAHTPGPWIYTSVYGPEADDVSFTVHQSDNAPSPIAHDIQTEADARLIAAAPKLLEALQKLAFEAEKRGGVPKAEISKARSAIAEATGRGMTTNRTTILGQFVRDELGVLHGRFSGLGIGSTALISEEVPGSEHLNLVADPLGAAYQVGVLMPKEKDGKPYYAGVLDSPIFPTPLNVLISPDEETPDVFNIVWCRA